MSNRYKRKNPRGRYVGLVHKEKRKGGKRKRRL